MQFTWCKTSTASTSESDKTTFFDQFEQKWAWKGPKTSLLKALNVLDLTYSIHLHAIKILSCISSLTKSAKQSSEQNSWALETSHVNSWTQINYFVIINSINSSLSKLVITGTFRGKKLLPPGAVHQVTTRWLCQQALTRNEWKVGFQMRS